jgi:elongation factor G
MPSYTTQDIRNIALVGNGGAGKTTLVEALLHAAGAIATPGRVDKGTTVSDFDPIEKDLLHSLDPTIVSLDHAGKHINLIDTPGLPDFLGRSVSVLPAVETVAVTIDPLVGVEMTTQRLLERAAERNLCRMIIVNKIDSEGADLPATLEQIREVFGKECLPINLPARGGSAVADCFFRPSGEATDFMSVEEAHTQIIDQVVEVDEALMEVYLEQGQELNPEQLHDPFEKALRDGHLVPVCFVSAQTGAGVRELLDVFARLMPNPLEGNPPPFMKGEGEAARPADVVPDPARHVVAHVFKVTFDPYLGKLAAFRVHQGTVTPNTQLFVGDARKPFKVAHLFKLMGKERTEVDAGIPGDICAVAKVDETHFDAVLHDSHEEDHFHLRSVRCPSPMFGLAIEVKKRGEEKKLSDGLHRIAEEDPCLVVEQNPSTNETVIHGLGEMHLRVVLQRMQASYNVEVETRPPRIPYRETISVGAEGHHRHKKQTGGAGQFGEVFLRIEPLPRGSGFEFVDAVVGGAIPNQFIPAVEKGVRNVLEGGAVAGYPLSDVRVTAYDGKSHPVDSKEIAFVTAGKKAFLDAISKAKPLVLEPIVAIQIKTPSSAVGDITGDLSSMRGRVNGTHVLPGGRIMIEGQVPLGEVGNYQSKLKSVTGGEGSYTIEFSHYDPVPPKLQQELIAAYKPREEEE